MRIPERRVAKTKVRASVDTAELGALAWGAPARHTPLAHGFSPPTARWKGSVKSPFTLGAGAEHVTVSMLFLTLSVRGIQMPTS